MNLPRWSLSNRTMVILVTLLLVIWGTYSYWTLPRREDPEIKIATALVITIYPGASAEKVERQVTSKLEDRIETLDQLDELESTTRENLSVITVTVSYDADTDIQWQKLRSMMDEAREDLPSTIIGPEVWDDFGDTTAMIVAIQGADPVTLSEVADDLESELRRVESVGDVSVHGEIPEVVYVEGDTSDMARQGIGPHEMSQIVSMRNLRIPGGSVSTGRFSYRVEPTGAFSHLDDIRKTIVAVSTETAQPLHLGDVFDVRRGLKDPPDYVTLHGGLRCMALGVVMKKDHNIVAMGDDVRRALSRFRPRLPAGVQMHVLHDSPRQVHGQVNGFMLNLLEGLGIVLVVMSLLLGIRASLMSAVSIPLSILVALALMPTLDVELEMVSIAAFIVALGMLVDNSIIVTDNIDIKLREGMAPSEAAWRGPQELAVPVLVGTAATVVAFMPMLLLSDEIGAYVRSLPVVVSVALGGSLLVSLCLTPIISTRLMRARSLENRSPSDRRSWSSMGARGYRWFMRQVLRVRWLIILLSLVSLAGAGLLLDHIGFSFFPDASRDQFTVEIWLREGSSIQETERVARVSEEMLLDDEDVESTLVHVGRGGPRFYITVTPEFMKSNYAQIMVNTSGPEATSGVIDRFNAASRTSFPGARVHAKKLVMGMPVDAPVAFRVHGEDLQVLRRISRQIQRILRDVEGTQQVRDNMGFDVPSLKVQVNEEMANRVGITNTDVALTFLSSYTGYELTRFAEDEDEIPVVLRLKAGDRNIEEGLLDLPVASTLMDTRVSLGAIATIRPTWSAGVIKRHEGRRAVMVMATNRGRLASEIVEDALPRIRALDLPPGYGVDVAGEKEEMDRAFHDLMVVFAVILVSLTLLLVLQFRSLNRAIVVLAVVPLSVLGASLGLALGGFSFSFMAFIGVVSLAGMVIKNSVVWVEFVERSRRDGASMREAVVEAGLRRLRPIVLTTVTTVGGLLPLAVFGGVLFEPMAWAMIGGLLVATILTLVVIPVLYTLLVRSGPGA